MWSWLLVTKLVHQFWGDDLCIRFQREEWNPIPHGTCSGWSQSLAGKLGDDLANRHAASTGKILRCLEYVFFNVYGCTHVDDQTGMGI
jgi:hypothetical protein